MASVPKKKKVRSKLPFKWTRIIKIDAEHKPFINGFNIADDTDAL